MGYERYPRGSNSQGDYANRGDSQNYDRDYGTGRYDSYSGARGYDADTGDDGRRGMAGRDYGRADYGNQRYAERDRSYGARNYGGSNYGSSNYGSSYAGGSDRQRDYGSQDRDRYGSEQYHGSYASDGRRFEDVGRYRNADDDYRQGDRGRSYGGQPQGYDYQDRGFFQRAGDEVRSWFGDDTAERRREEDARRDEQYYNRGDHGSDRHRDADYHGWRSSQMAALDRDYDEYRQENRSKFETEFSNWRTNRQGQRDLLGKVTEHAEVVGSDGEHVGTVDKVRGDRILLTKNDADAGGRHHSIPSSWLDTVDGKVKLRKTAAEAKKQWQDEERNQALFQYGDNTSRDGATTRSSSATSTDTAKTY